MVRIVNQNRCVGDLHVLLQFAEEQHGKLRCSVWEEPDVEKCVRFGIDSGVLPATFVIHLDHHLVNRDVTRRRIAGRLYDGFLHPVVEVVQLCSTPYLSRYCLVFESDSPARCS